jgi:N-acetylmuramoyl-L-alanine amidase
LQQFKGENILKAPEIITIGILLFLIIGYAAKNNQATDGIIPGGNKPKASATNGVRKTPALNKVYLVKKGDTLNSIAKKHQITVDELKAANGLSSDVIYVNDYLAIPDHAETPADPSTPGKTGNDVLVIKVKEGERLLDIAGWDGKIARSILRLNRLPNIRLKAGQQLLIPDIYSDIVSAKMSVVRKRSSNTDGNILTLAKVINTESRGEPYQGQVAVGAVVINRLLNPIFPDDLNGVVFAPGQFAYSNAKPQSSSLNAAIDAAGGADPTYGALFFYNPKTSTDTGWVTGRRIAVKIGSHVFLY